jgi:hypothetical protein
MNPRRRRRVQRLVGLLINAGGLLVLINGTLSLALQ